MNPVIEVRSLRFAYPDGTLALDGIDVTIDSGESVALFGPNGSGKTTFVLHLNGLLAGEGDVRICGEPIGKRNLRRIRQQVGLVFQDADDQLFMPTVGEDVAFGPLNLGATPEEAQRAAAAALEQVGLAGMERRAPYHLSAGEKRRAALAGVLAMAPEILVLDEPTTALDPPGRLSLIGLLSPLRQTKLVVTHDTELARHVCGRALFFEKGKITCDGPLQQVIERMQWGAGELWSSDFGLRISNTAGA
jgi:cobalt/nickel transport system ATP-binding protein